MDMTPGAACPGLVRVDEETLVAKQLAQEPPEEIVAIERALHFDADYVYFRRVVGRPSMAVAYLYDRTERLIEARQAIDDALPEALRVELAELQRRCWSACEIPVVYVFFATWIDVYHILQGPLADPQGSIQANPWKTIKLAGEIAHELAALKKSLEPLSARRLDDGRLLEEDPDALALKPEGAAFMALSQQLDACRIELNRKSLLSPKLVTRFMILFVMIKYLEEQRDAHDRGVFPPGTFAEFAAGATEFVGVLRGGGRNTLAFIEHLARKDRFNGDVFLLDADEQEVLRSTNLDSFADFLEGHIDGTQRTMSFWRRYAFKELPVELISHLYEQFLPRQAGVVYTPPFLVNFILDEVLPLSQKTSASFRLIDPACGSGVFLVGAFRRLVHRWRANNNYRYPDVKTLKEILLNHIFGVDIEGEAVRITLFSLSVALCDFLDPRVIWDELHFDPLMDTNLMTGDFFALKKQQKWTTETGFDLVVGNPPFDSKITEPGYEELAEIRITEPEFDLPDKQIALLFLKSATRIAKPAGQIALVQPAAPLLYGKNSRRFRSDFLRLVHVPQIVDFTHLSRVLFKRKLNRALDDTDSDGTGNPGDVAVAVIFAANQAPGEGPLLHVTVRRAVAADQKLLFEIDHYDLHFIRHQQALEDPGIWKANFIGGGRISQLLQRLARVQNLGTFLVNMQRTRGWEKGEGYIAGKKWKIARLEDLLGKEAHRELSDAERDDLKKLKKRHRQAPWLTGHRVLSTRAFTANGIDETKTEKIEQGWFTEPRRAGLFSAPMLLIKDLVEANSDRIPVVLLENESIRFKDRIFGIHAPRADLAQLKRIKDTIEDGKLVRFSLLATSGEHLVNRSSAVQTADILKVPFPDLPGQLRNSPFDEAIIDDVLKYVADFKRIGECAAVQQPPSDKQLRQFGDYFCRVLGSVYPTLHAAKPVRMTRGICYPFYFGEAPSEHVGSDDAEPVDLDALLDTAIGSSLRCQRILRVFQGNMLFLVKPARLRYWLRSIAIRDADEMFIDLKNRGY
jgi:hypothetical protein